MARIHVLFLAGASALTLGACFSNNSSSAKAPPTAGADAPAPDGIQAQIDLGFKLMFDERLSEPRGIACGTCHDPDLGWGDARPQGKGVQDNTLSTAGHDPALAVEGNRYKTLLTGRNTPTVYNSHLFQHLFWDKRAGDLAHQAAFPFESSVEMNTDWDDFLIPLMQSDPDYVALFDAAYGPGSINQVNATAAIGAYEATISVFDTPFDQWLAGDTTALTTQELEGKDLFFGKAGCWNCHPTPFLTDFKEHNLGVPNAGTFALNGEVDFGFGKRTDLTGSEPVEIDDPQDYCKFKTPQLRMIAVTGPFMHNGAFATLEEVVDFYDQGGDADLCGTFTKSALIQPLNLTQSEKDALVAFLRDGLLGTEIK
ncbi:MAG: cytochrome c peroxidase [Planctomycetota bacterium]